MVTSVLRALSRVALVAMLATVTAIGGCSLKSGGLGAAVDGAACTIDCDAGSEVATDAPIDAPDDTPPPPPTAFIGGFVGAAVSGNAGGVQLTGACTWGAAVHGSAGAIVLTGTLQ